MGGSGRPGVASRSLVRGRSATFAASFPRLAGRPELIDGPLDDSAALREILRDLRRVNRWLGGAALSRSALMRLLARPRTGGVAVRSTAAVRLLDVGTGSADIPAELLRWAARRGMALEIEGVDSRAEMIAAANVEHGSVPGLRLRVADARSLPYRDGSFHVAHTSLVAHHLEPDELEASLAELSRVSSVGVIVNDLDRTVVALAGALMLSRVFTRNPVTRHDGPLSVRRAYRPDELHAIATRAGLEETVVVRGILRHRYAIGYIRKDRGRATSTAPQRANSSS